MSIFADKETRVVVQGITGREGQFHTRHCIDYGTQIVAGVTPGKAGQKMDDVPVFNTVQDAVNAAALHISEAQLEKVDAICPPPWHQPDPIRD